jgi:hypothetical protein
MKLQKLILITFTLTGLSACNFEENAQQLTKEKIGEDMGVTVSDESEETNISQSKATLEMTIDGKNYDASCNEHYLNIAKEPYGDLTSYSLRINFDKNASQLNAFQLTFKQQGKIELPYEVELDFKKSATDNKLKTYLTVFYIDENNKVVQTSNDVGKIIITEMSEDKISMEVDTKLLLLSTVNTKGEGQTVHLKGTVQSSYPIITMMNGATKEEVF